MYNGRSMESPCEMAPMDNSQFNYRLAGRMQMEQLNNSAEIQKTLENHRMMERDAHKSVLKQQEIVLRQRCKERSIKIQEDTGSTKAIIVDGNHNTISTEIVFGCTLKGVRRFERKNCEYFQLILEKPDGSRLESELYDSICLKSITRFKTTCLSVFQSGYSSNAISAAWEWIWKRAMVLYESNTQSIVLPSGPGWFKNKRGYKYVAAGRIPKVYSTSSIELSSLKYYAECSAKKIMDEFEKCRQTCNSLIGVLLLFRIYSLLETLCPEHLPRVGIILVGKKSSSIARCLLSIAYRTDEVINVDTDRIGFMRNIAKSKRDSSMIFVINNLENRSARNRMNDILSWLASGYVEGIPVCVPYIFCVEKFSKELPLDDFVVIETEEINPVEVEKAFDYIQSFIIDAIENGGVHVAESLISWIKTDGGLNTRETMTGIFRGVYRATESLFGADADKLNFVFEMFQIGVTLIEKQFSIRYSTVLEQFKIGVINLSKYGKLHFWSTNCKERLSELDTVVFFDDEHYYFNNMVLSAIVEAMTIERKSLLYIKQQLSEHNLLKVYRNSGAHNREYNVDVSYKDTKGKTEYISVLAIKRNFWDELGGLSLLERRG